MTESRLMKDGLGNRAIERIADFLKSSFSEFPKAKFINEAEREIQTFELKGRVRYLIRVLHKYLPHDFKQVAQTLAAGKEDWDPGDSDDNLAGFAAWPLIDYIGEYGLDHPEVSLNALKELTSMFSAEFAIRPFIIEHFELTFQIVSTWTTDPDEHVRRLVSEGSRPRLPWGQQLPQFIADPSPVFQLLEKLKDDPSEYVRRSVANNLNDISKDHPETVIALCKRWKKGASKERQWVIRHATRSLVKTGHPAVFGLLGFTEDPQLDFQSLEVSARKIQLGEAIEFTAKLKSTSSNPQSLVIDYAIHHMKANGKTAPKVFKFRTLEIGPGETVELVKRHSIKPITTRKYHPGEHAVEILINGKSVGRKGFVLKC